MVIGEKDEDYRKSNLSGIFNEYRPQKALWSFAIQPGSKHDHVDDSIKHVFFDAVIPLRVPDLSNSDETTPLKTIDESVAWLGDSKSYSISSYADYHGDRKKASWLPNEDFAKVWLDFIRK